MSLSLFLVGVGSFVFHATLRQFLQYCDDLSMFALAASLIERLYSINQDSSTRRLVSILTWSSTVAVSIFYVVNGNLLVHTYSFAAMLTFIWPRTLYLMKTNGQRIIWARAVVLLVIAFVLWNIDLRKCFELRKMRNQIGLPWAFLLELHGWWHILTAVGASEYIKLVRDLSRSDVKTE